MISNLRDRASNLKSKISNFNYENQSDHSLLENSMIYNQTDRQFANYDKTFNMSRDVSMIEYREDKSVIGSKS